MKTSINKTTETVNSITSLLPICVIALIIAACSTTKKSQQASKAAVAIEFNADSAYAFCAAQCNFGPRVMNSEAHEQCAQWIASQFSRFGYNVELQRADLKGYDGTVLKSTNIIAKAKATTKAPLSSPEGDTEADSAANNTIEAPSGAVGGARPEAHILLCAHWDSRPWADNDPDSANWRKPVMAANDGASGVAVMLELARLLQQHDSARIAVDFVCFDAEDWGVPQWSDAVDADSWALGAQYWAAHHKSPRYDFAILLDMVGGQQAKFYRELHSMQYASNVVDMVWQAASAAGYGSTFPHKDGGWITDDHVPVNEQANIPCIDIINHYPDCPQGSFGPTWHTVNDDLQHIDRNTLRAVGQTLVQLIYQ